MIEVMEVDDYMSLLLVVNRLPDHEAGRYKQCGLVYPFHPALYMENVVMFIEYCFVMVAERIGTVGQLVILVTVNKRDFHHLFRR